MEVLTGGRSFAEFISSALDATNSFRLVDVGCSNGIHDAFRAFGNRLQAWAFDIDEAECRKLQATETLAGVHYIAGAVGLPPDHPFQQARSGRPGLPGNPWERLSTPETWRLRSARASSPQSQSVPAPTPSSKIELTRFFEDNAIDDLDFIKIDVDGEDFAILSGLDHTLSELNVLGVGIEVNFFGTDHPTDHTWHNVDRFMRSQGYDLFALTTRHYSALALPSRYAYWFPTETQFGRLLQGDAFYMRDLCAQAMRQEAERLGPAKLLKAAAILSLGNLPDCAAEILTTFRDELSSTIVVDAGLNLLAATVRRDGMPTGYAAYMAAFHSDAPFFYTPRPTPGVTSPVMDLDELLRQNGRLREELRAVHQSTCWQATAPIRWLVNMLRGSDRLQHNP